MTDAITVGGSTRRRQRCHVPVPQPGRGPVSRDVMSSAGCMDAPPEMGDEGLTLVELLVAFAALTILITLVATAVTTYLNVGTNVISSYSATQQLLPSSITIQRLIRSEVEPAPTPTAGASIPRTGTSYSGPWAPTRRPSTPTSAVTTPPPDLMARRRS